MDAFEPYNHLVRACFENPAHAGDVGPGYAEYLSADVSEPGSGARLQLFAGVERGRISALRFRTWGCPHLVAAAELYCREHEGRELASSGEVDLQEIMDRLAVPVSKTGRLLLIEDAARLLAAGGHSENRDEN
jgi:NifU-like protein involved in Fe-S cluster formation